MPHRGWYPRWVEIEKEPSPEREPYWLTVVRKQ
ncbi:Uncharacterised protein [Neisseria canis]|uniref:Uncharacterized protein n=1 Tax=Neisseria canis TaxID=493 RepID=A0A3S4PII5_9NEIS|nr:Uncharacterised protein [Neisseria canis]